MSKKNLWAGVSDVAQSALVSRNYKAGSFAQRLVQTGVEAGELAGLDRRKPEAKKIWIPGVEIFPRQIHYLYLISPVNFCWPMGHFEIDTIKTT